QGRTGGAPAYFAGAAGAAAAAGAGAALPAVVGAGAGVGAAAVCGWEPGLIQQAWMRSLRLRGTLSSIWAPNRDRQRKLAWTWPPGRPVGGGRRRRRSEGPRRGPARPGQGDAAPHFEA